MHRDTDFSTIKGIARIRWDIETATPLCIKAGTTSQWNQATLNYNNRPKKLRLCDSTFDFFQKDNQNKDDASVSDFYHDSYIKSNELKIRYNIPASSVRGALRNYTITRLMKKLTFHTLFYTSTLFFSLIIFFIHPLDLQRFPDLLPKHSNIPFAEVLEVC